MGTSVLMFCTDCLLCGVLIASAWTLVDRLAAPGHRGENPRWLVPWAIKGLTVPILIWAVMNLGVSWRLQPFMPEVQFARNKGGAWFGAFLGVLAKGG